MAMARRYTLEQIEATRKKLRSLLVKEAGKTRAEVAEFPHVLLRVNLSFFGKLCAELLSLIVTSYSDGPSIENTPVAQQFLKLFQKCNVPPFVGCFIASLCFAPNAALFPPIPRKKIPR